MESSGGTAVRTEEPKRNGALEMQHAADRASLENAAEIVDALLKSALKGHIQSIKFLFLLAQGRQEDQEMEGKAKLRDTLAAEWEADKKWLAEMANENAKAIISQRPS